MMCVEMNRILGLGFHRAISRSIRMVISYMTGVHVAALMGL